MKHLLVSWALLSSASVCAQDSTQYAQQEIIYGRRDGMALTTTLVSPKKANGKAIVSLVSGSWFSNYSMVKQNLQAALPFLTKGYTVFLVLHRAAPRYAIPDAFRDVQRAIQYIRFNASRYGLDPDHIGITGGSSGGHLALLAATANDTQNLSSTDPVERVSSKVQAVAVFSLPTDFLNFGQAGLSLTTQKPFLQAAGVVGAFQYTKWDSLTRTYVIIDNKTDHRRLDSLHSPAQLVSPDDAPAYLMHGDEDRVVPFQQSQLMAQKLKAANVPVVLRVKAGAGHGWDGQHEDLNEFVRWFDKYLLVKQ